MALDRVCSLQILDAFLEIAKRCSVVILAISNQSLLESTALDGCTGYGCRLPFSGIFPTHGIGRPLALMKALLVGI
jgi:hypothetical protein